MSTSDCAAADPLEALAGERIGSTIGSFQIESLLGVGGMGSVYVGTRGDGFQAAVKVLHSEFGAFPEVRKRFLREGPLGQALTSLAPLCEGIVPVLESGETQDHVAYLAMELLRGEPLRDRLANGPLPVDEVLALAEQVLAVLATTHSYGVIHRDLKPENMHVDERGRVRVLDFGIARVLDDLPEGVATLPDKTATRAGNTLGTCGYMAPEQATGLIDEIDGRTDLFGLGATLFELLSGRTIHGDLPHARLLVAAVTRPAPPLRSIAPHLPADVCAVVDRALAFLKTQRYPHARLMRSDVRALRRGKPPPYAQAIAEGRVQPGASP